MEPEFSYKYYEEYGLIEIYVDGKIAGEWADYVGPDDQLAEFKRIFLLGMNYRKHLNK